MKIQLTVSIPGGLSVARKERIAIRQATQNAIAVLIQQQLETHAGRIVNGEDEQIGEVECLALYAEEPLFPRPARANHGVLHVSRSDVNDPARVAVETGR